MLSDDIEVREMKKCDEYYVGTCTHTNESEETDVCSNIRVKYLKKMYGEGLRVKVALYKGKHAGFIYMMPIEVSPWGPKGEDLLFIPCLVSDIENKGVGKALINSAEEEAKRQNKKGLLTKSYYWDFFFMPAEFFEKMGFSIVQKRDSKEAENVKSALMWKVWDEPKTKPDFLHPDYEYEPIEGKVVVDLFWNTFCQTSVIEANRVKRIVEEYGDKVVLKEHRIDDREDLMQHQISRAIYINGEEIYWGYEAPEEGIREAVEKAISGPAEI